jgi:hypothetical protein
MASNELRKAYRARPFRPFRVHLADGREIPVTHPELLALSPDGRTAAVFVPGEGFEILDVPLVTGISVKRGGRSQGA